MRIGIITFYRVPNFGANLQAISTFFCLKKLGHTPIYIQYVSRFTDRIHRKMSCDKQIQEHFKCIDSLIEQTHKCYNSSDVKSVIKEYDLEAVIVGSDAVGQHHPLFSTLRWGQSLKSWLRPIQPERRFPNPFWTCGFTADVPMAFMSVSSQNSPYTKFTKSTKRKMLDILNQMKYVSARDTWTYDMYRAIGYTKDIPITPDPVFAFNQNVGEQIPSKEEIMRRFSLPEKYALVGMKNQYLSFDELNYIKSEFKKENTTVVSFPITEYIHYQHPFDKSIGFPLSPIDWYAIIKYSSAYIGNNMHPIVVCLHNAIPCFSLDNWGTTNFWGHKIKDNSSKVLDVLKLYGLEKYRAEIENGVSIVSPQEIMDRLRVFPKTDVQRTSDLRVIAYNDMIDTIIKCIKCQH